MALRIEGEHRLQALTREARGWERPEGMHVPEGEKTGIGPDIYGGGTWWVLGTEWIWYVQNNGSDGADWGSNNVRTGGAGAIGWRTAATPEMATLIRDLIAMIQS